MKYTYILFDLDGTLTDPEEGITKCVQYALKGLGIDEADLKKLKCFIGPPLRESFIKYYRLSEDEAKKAVEKYRERFVSTGMYENVVLAGVPGMLERLRSSGRVLAVASSKPTVYVDKILEKYGLSPYFSCVVGSELDGARSCKSEVIEEAFRRLQVKNEDKVKTVMIGDREQDIFGARENGIDSIGLRAGYAEENELEDAGATHIVKTISELERLLMGDACIV